MRISGVVLAAALASLPLLSVAQQQQHHPSGHPAGHPANAHGSTSHMSGHAPMQSHAAPMQHHAAPMQHHAAPMAPAGHTTHTSSGHVNMRSTNWVHGVTSYHAQHYHTTLNVSYASHAGNYPNARWVSSGGHRWYNGYWHNYWGNQDWIWWNGNYGFWLDYGGINVFVYENAPGQCMYWNGYAWVAWYDPPFTPYGCPY